MNLKNNLNNWLYSLRTRILIYFSILFLVMIIIINIVEIYGIPFLSVTGSYKNIHQEAINDLNLVADLKQEKLQRWITERKGDIQLLSNSFLIQHCLKDIIKSEIPDYNSRSFMDLLKHLKLTKVSYGVYSKIQIISKVNNKIIVSTEIEENGKTIIDSEIVRREGANDEILITLIKEKNDSDYKILLEQKIKSKDLKSEYWTLLYITPDGFLIPFLHTGDGLGKTGEALLVNNDRAILNQLKHPLVSGDIAKPLQYKISALPASYAAMGKQGYIETEDYRKVPVLAAYRYIRITESEGWGMVVKIDKDEAFSSLWKHVELSWIYGLIWILILFSISVILAKNLSRPIEELTRAADQIKNGKLDTRVSTKEKGELGELFVNFNSMTEKLENWHNDLEYEVKQRTKELKSTNRKLQKEIKQRKEAEGKLKEYSESLEEKVQERTFELQDKANHLEKSQKAMAFLLEDVNEIRDELELTNKKLEMANKELESFSYSVSHDLRAPLRAINGFTQKLWNYYGEHFDEEALRIFQIIQSSSKKMGNLIDDLLSFSRLGRQPLRFSEINMQQLVRDVFEEMKHLYEDREIQIDLQTIPEAYGDISLIKQVVSNLISNAIKFSTNRSESKIEVAAEKKKDELVYWIKDNGVGFNMKYYDKLFGVFQRLHNESEFPGTGVGLALVQRIMFRHGGKVWAESEENKGTTFYFSFNKNGVVNES